VVFAPIHVSVTIEERWASKCSAILTCHSRGSDSPELSEIASSSRLTSVLADLSTSKVTDFASTSPYGAVFEIDENRFVTKNNGVLFENDLLQLGVKSEFRGNLGRLALYFGNKTTFPLNNFVSEVSCPGNVGSQLSIQAKPVDPLIEGGAQKQQMINVECVTDFSEAPTLNCSFMYTGVPQRISCRLPLMLNKFIEGTEMDTGTFFNRWKILAAPAQECQKIFKATTTMDTEAVKVKLVGTGINIIDGIDSNPENFVGAGIIHTRTQQIGCLLRLEPNKQAQMYRLTIRCSKDNVAKTICELVEPQL